MFKTSLVNLTCIIFFVCAACFPAVAQVNLGNGLMVHLPFNGNANDASGNGHHGVLTNGPTLTTDRFGVANQAYRLDGVDDYIKIEDPDGKMSTTPFSIVLWFYLESTDFKALIGKRQHDVSGGEENKQQYQLSIFRSNPAGIFSGVTNPVVGCNGTIGLNVLSYTNYSQSLCLNRWFNIIVTFDGVKHRMFLDGKLVSESTPNFNEMLKCNADIRLGNWWMLDPLSFKGKLDDFRWYNRILTADEIEVLSAAPAPLPADLAFVYKQNVCNPLSVNFTASSTKYNSFRWDFNDGSPLSNGQTPTHVFPGPGNYLVKLIGGTGACIDTIKKQITLNRPADATFLQKDTTICLGSELILRADSAQSYCWGGGNTQREYKVKPTQKTTYAVTILREGPNLIPNGNFTSGNAGYTSDYFYNSPNGGTGEIFIGSDPKTWNANFCNSCGDHTTGTGNLLMVNAPLTQDSRIWYRNVTVSKNTTYSFSFWIYTNSAGNQPSVKVNINNVSIGSYATVAANNNQWTRVIFNWNSENATAAAISIVGTNSSTSNGNDFGLDDIAFTTTTLVSDSVTVDVKSSIGALSANPDTAVCPGESLQLKVTGSLNIKWSPASGLSDVSSPTPTVVPTASTTYIVSNTDNSICPANDTVVVTLKTKPLATTSNDTLLCSGKPGMAGIQLNSGGGSTYFWFPAVGLSNTNIANPVANPALTTLYKVAVTGSNGCKDTGEVKISVSAFANVKASADVAACLGKAVNLFASGASDYSWSPAWGLSSSDIANPVAAPVTTTSYVVSSPSAGACSGKDTVVVQVNALPTVLLSPGDTVLCTGSGIRLQAGGGVQYKWSPSAGLSDINIPTPLASPVNSTTYTVEVIDANGCISTRGQTVDVKNPVKIVGSSDVATCAGSPVTLHADGAGDYQWLPSAGLSNNNVSNPVARPTQTTSYIVSSPSAGLCSVNDTVTVTVHPVPHVNVTPAETTICQGAMVQLAASGASTYSWSPGTGLNDPASANPEARPTSSITYTVKGTGQNGCADSSSVKVIVGPAGKIFIPNAFTPNGDGLNDCFGIKSAVGAESFELAVYNRWGERVFYTKDPAVCWNGVYKGKAQLNGNYVYVVKIKSPCGTVNEKGLVTLIK